MGINVRPNIVTSGLILHLDAANTKSYPRTGTTWTDLSGNRKNGTLTNGPVFSSINGGNIVFNGTNTYCLISTQVLVSSTLPQTLSVYCKTNATNYSSEMITLRDDATDCALRLVFDSDNKFYASFIREGAALYQTGSPVISDISRYYMVTGTYNGSTLTFYLNGVKLGSTSYLTTNGTNNNGNSSQVVGSSWTYGTPGTAQRFFNGAIASVQMYNRALSDLEVLQNYNATKSRFGLT